MHTYTPESLVPLKDFVAKYPHFGTYGSLRAKLRRLSGAPGLDKAVVRFGRSVLINPIEFASFIANGGGRA